MGETEAGYRGVAAAFGDDAIPATAEMESPLIHWAKRRNRNVGITSVLRRYFVGAEPDFGTG
ncbi:MAG: hypothetical protein RIE24_19175 [Silicimonas sp.]